MHAKYQIISNLRVGGSGTVDQGVRALVTEHGILMYVRVCGL